MICLTSEFLPMTSTDFSCHNFILVLLVLSLIETHTGGHTIDCLNWKLSGQPQGNNCVVSREAVLESTGIPFKPLRGLRKVQTWSWGRWSRSPVATVLTSSISLHCPSTPPTPHSVMEADKPKVHSKDHQARDQEKWCSNLSPKANCCRPKRTDVADKGSLPKNSFLFRGC